MRQELVAVKAVTLAQTLSTTHQLSVSWALSWLYCNIGGGALSIQGIRLQRFAALRAGLSWACACQGESHSLCWFSTAVCYNAPEVARTWPYVLFPALTGCYRTPR